MARPDREDTTAKTYLLGRSRTPRGFNRAGLKFGPEWEAFPLADLKPEQIERVLAETTMLDSRLATAAEVKQLVKLKAASLDESVTKTELVQYIAKLEHRLTDQAERIRDLEVKLTGDRPPKSAADLTPPPPGHGEPRGNVPPGVTPPPTQLPGQGEPRR